MTQNELKEQVNREMNAMKPGYRRCHSCGSVAYHLDNVYPFVNCRECGSQDTRLLKDQGEYKYGNAAGLEAKLLPGEPWFALRAKDAMAVEAVLHYADVCEKAGLKDHAEGVRRSIQQMEEWRKANPQHVKMPD